MLGCVRLGRTGMRRRAFMAGLGAAAAWPVLARGQQGANVSRIGVLNPGFADPPGLGALYEGLRELGYIEGRNIAIERRYAEWKSDRYAALAAELVRLNVQLIVVMSTSPARAAQQATHTIPLVVPGMADPVADGLVATLARPGGNITGNTFLGPELIPKRIGLLKQAVPGLTRLAALWHSNAYGARTMDGMRKETQVAATATGLDIRS